MSDEEWACLEPFVIERRGAQQTEAEEPPVGAGWDILNRADGRCVARFA